LGPGLLRWSPGRARPGKKEGREGRDLTCGPGLPVRRRGREHAEPGAGQLGLRPRGVRPSEGEGGGRAACFQLGQRGEEERGRFFLFLLFIFFFFISKSFQSCFKSIRKYFDFAQNHTIQ